MGCLRAVCCIGALVAMAAAAGAARQAQPEPARPKALVAELDGIIHPVSAEYLTETIDEADTSGADLVVVVLRTPGGLLDSTRTIVSRLIPSRAPVVVFVSPSGARAASLVHLAAFYDFSSEDDARYDAVNVRGTERLARVLGQELELEQILFASTMLVHPPCRPGERITEEWPIEPRWAYPRSKAAAES